MSRAEKVLYPPLLYGRATSISDDQSSGVEGCGASQIGLQRILGWGRLVWACCGLGTRPDWRRVGEVRAS